MITFIPFIPTLIKIGISIHLLLCIPLIERVEKTLGPAVFIRPQHGRVSYIDLIRRICEKTNFVNYCNITDSKLGHPFAASIENIRGQVPIVCC